jgi:ATP-binding cassette, subfamily B, bacterial
MSTGSSARPKSLASAISYREIPAHVAEILKSLGIDAAQIEAAIRGDLDMTGRIAESWVVVTPTQVVGIVPQAAPEERVCGPYDRDKVEKVRIFRGVGSSFLQVRTQKLFLDVVRFSNSRREEFDRVRLYLEEAINGKPKLFSIFEKANPWICPKCGLALPGRNAVCPRCAHEGELFARTLGMMKPYLVWVMALLALMLAGVTLDLLPPYLTRILVDDVLTSKKHVNLLVWLVLALAGASLLRAFLNIGIGRLSTSIGTRITYNLRCQLHQKLSALSVDFHDRSSLGNLITRLLGDVDYFHGFVQQMAQGFFVNILLVLGIGVMLFRLNFMLALYVMIPIPFVVTKT